ncbi:MAG: TIGR03943 family protein [Synechococcales cyanobacterium T60_A2020_003]|nr:TIGR03943 family protein [Synechococcales cyanobacterium T60_A2020_003]
MKPRVNRSTSQAPLTRRIPWSAMLDLLAIAAWGALLLKYWLTGKMNILLHPDYHWLAVSAGIFLVVLSVLKLGQLLKILVDPKGEKRSLAAQQHIALFKPGVGSAILLFVAIVGLQFTPQPFTSAVALQRGITETLSMTRSQPQAFRGTTAPEDRSIIDWVRTLNVYPEPDAYAGQPVQVDGFAVHLDGFPDHYFTISRFVITCCAADVYPVGLPVKLSGSQSIYPADQWFRVKGKMITETHNDIRQVVIEAEDVTEIPEPENPYEY